MVPRFTDAAVAASVRRLGDGIVASAAAAGCAATAATPETWRVHDMAAAPTPENVLMFTMILVPPFVSIVPTGRF